MKESTFLKNRRPESKRNPDSVVSIPLSAGRLSRDSNGAKWDRRRGWRLAKVARQEVQGFDYVSREQCDGFVGQCADRSLIIPRCGCGRNHPESSDPLRRAAQAYLRARVDLNSGTKLGLMKFKRPRRVRRRGQQPPRTRISSAPTAWLLPGSPPVLVAS